MNRKSFFSSLVTFLSFGLIRPAKAAEPVKFMICLRDSLGYFIYSDFDAAAGIEASKVNFLLERINDPRRARIEALQPHEHADDPFRDGYRYIVIS